MSEFPERKSYGMIGQRLVHFGLITEEQLEAALEYQKTNDVFLGTALIRMNVLTEKQLLDFLNNDESIRLGELLIREGQISRKDFRRAQNYQHEYGGRFGTICVQLGIISEDTLNRAIASQPERGGLLGSELIRRGLITPQQLDKALEMQKKSGGKLGEILQYQKSISSNDLYRTIADLKKMGRYGVDAYIKNEHALPYDVALRLHAIIIRQEQSFALVAVEDKLDQDAISEIEKIINKKAELILCNSNEFFNFWERTYSVDESDKSVFGLYEKNPENSAIVTFTTGQIVFMLLLLIALIIFGVMVFREKTLLVMMIVFQAIYLLMALGKFYIVIKGTSKNAQLRFSKEEVDALDEKDLPVYTVLIPVYKEKEVIMHLLDRIEKMDYPKYKLDVRILLEQDDRETIECVQSMNLPSYFTPVIVPYSLPKTKPKACNYGLIGARGQYVVIYDAQDRPEPDQLKKACLAFKRLPKEYVCIQAKLNYFNSKQNWLTKLFTQEYSMWFELLLVGIMQIDIPIPLGGTSNHFRAEFLRQVGGWDPFNVTQDADLGIRLYKYHYRTAVLDSRTWEEANSNLKNWIRQRSRWIKGYMQTFFVHMRNPIRFFRTIGFKGSLGYIAMIFGTPFLPLINPIFWAMLIIWFLFEPSWIQSMFPGLLYYVAAVQLILGNFVFMYMNMVGSYYVIRDCALKKRQPFSYSLIRYGLLTPLYWVFMSIAAYKALFQLFIKPFYWEKTNHGLTNNAPPPSATGDPNAQEHE